MAEQPIEDDDELALEEDDQLLHFTTRDDRQCTADPGNIDKGPQIDEPPALERVMDEAIDMIRRFKDSRSILSEIPRMLYKYLEDRNLYHFMPDEFDEDVFAPLRDLVTSIERYYDGELNNDVMQDKIRNLLEPLCQKVLEIKRGCAVCVLEFEDELQLAQLIEELSMIAAKVKSWLQEEFLKKEDIEIAMERANLPHPAAVDAIQRLFDTVGENLRIHVSITCKQLIARLTSKSDTVEVTIIVKLGNFPFPSDEKADARKDSLIRRFSDFKQVQKAFMNVFQTSKEVQSGEYEYQMQASLGKEKMAELEEPMKQMGLQEEDKSQVSKKEMGAKSKVVEQKPRCTIFVEGSGSDMTEFNLFQRFKEFGPVQYTAVKRGQYGYVRFDTASAAENAASSGDPTVQLSHQAEPLYQQRVMTTLEFRNVQNPDDGTLHDLCDSYGKIVKFTSSRYNRKAYVKFKEEESASKALADLQAKDYYVFRARKEPQPK